MSPENRATMERLLGASTPVGSIASLPEVHLDALMTAVRTEEREKAAGLVEALEKIERFGSGKIVAQRALATYRKRNQT